MGHTEDGKRKCNGCGVTKSLFNDFGLNGAKRRWTCKQCRATDESNRGTAKRNKVPFVRAVKVQPLPNAPKAAFVAATHAVVPHAWEDLGADCRPEWKTL